MERLVAALLLFVAAPAVASTQHRMLWGIALEERFDSGAYQGGNEWMSKLAPEIGYAAKNEARSLEARYAPDLVHHLHAADVSLDHRVLVEYSDRPMERLTLKADGSYYHVQDMASLPRLGLARVRAPALWAKGGLTADTRLSHTLTAELAYRGEATRVFLNALPLGASHTFWGQVRQQSSPRLELGLRYRLQVFTADVARYAEGHAATASARYLLARHTFVAVEAGPMLFHPTQQSGTWLPRGTVEVVYEARGVYAGLSLGRDIVGAAGYASAVWADYIQGAGTWRINERWNLWLGAGYYRNGLAPHQPADARGLTTTAGVEWRFAKNLAVSGGYDRMGQFAQAETALGLTRNIVSLRLSYRAP